MRVYPTAPCVRIYRHDYRVVWCHRCDLRHCPMWCGVLCVVVIMGVIMTMCIVVVVDVNDTIYVIVNADMCS